MVASTRDETPSEARLPDKNQDEVIDFLSQPEAYGGGMDLVKSIITHTSIVFLAGDHAYKLKKVVRFSYLYFFHLSALQRFCQAGLEINRLTAPGLYERVAAVTRSPDGGMPPMPRWRF
jgi:hypothetical protein